ncbi:MAG TPA: (Fe-S)-binding protein [Gammaproteobacteria bacterium]|nr:(Fe-S)-binding protein [Gammaproteobacteria bacterium]
MPSSSPASTAQNDQEIRLLREADTCVKCGLCLPQCPTYVLAADEAESPRGRIALLQGLLSGALPVTPALRTHLDHCLNCRHCEVVCPAEVPYGRLIDGARAALRARGHRAPFVVRLLHGLAPRHGVLRRLGQAARLAQALGLLALVRALAPRQGLVHRLAALAAQSRPGAPPPSFTPARVPRRGAVTLFRGCIADAFDTPTREAARMLLAAAGYDVHVPEGQTCCGALHLHDGDTATARMLARQNQIALDSDEREAIVTTASGCGAQLAEYGAALGQEQGGFRRPVMDVCAFLARTGLPPDFAFAPLNRRVALHTPCTLRNVQRAPDAAAVLLARIPGLVLSPLSSAGCCGAAGSQLLTAGAQADALAGRLAQEIITCRAELVLTSNIGCALNLRLALARAGAAHIEVMHPVALLARQMTAEHAP